MPNPTGRFELEIKLGGNVIVSRSGHSQTVRHEDLSRHGWNALADAARLIQAKEEGCYK